MPELNVDFIMTYFLLFSHFNYCFVAISIYRLKPLQFKNNNSTFIAAQVFYSVVYVSVPNVIGINRDTGALRLISSLSSLTSEIISVTLRASDGLHEQVARVTIHVVEQNRYAPAFSKETYSLSLKESTAVGTTVLRVSAVDTDSYVLAFSVVSGNTGNVFSLKPLSGTIIIQHNIYLYLSYVRHTDTLTTFKYLPDLPI